MKERPILFNDQMVRAILEGRKTVTRRVVKPAPVGDLKWNQRSMNTGIVHNWTDDLRMYECPYGQPGGQLWVRETWQYADWTEEGEPYIRYQADGARVLHEDFPIEWAPRIEREWVELSDPANYAIDGRAADRRWRPSIHIPRWASRILLEITDVRVERLQDITPNQCIAEGAWREKDKELGRGQEAIAAFADLWRSTGGDWDANPWVWCVSFRRVEQ
ncbi:hypothetical protein [Pseudomonas aeruginosa]|uniref:hypothetical protein n=1 Tax=Pseudomonas aeruginosa TaxID=287 RepID=UPI000EB5F468|nr:hypothetical protein [Pseudomonas aeruginosa]